VTLPSWTDGGSEESFAAPPLPLESPGAASTSTSCRAEPPHAPAVITSSQSEVQRRTAHQSTAKLGGFGASWYTHIMRWIAAALVLLVTPLAGAEDRTQVVVTVGQTVSREVGYAMGHLCDDETIVRAEMKNGTFENNLFVVTGVKPGTTLCRAGTVQDRPTLLFEITVVAAKPRR
jgi:hypothetical protein